MKTLALLSALLITISIYPVKADRDRIQTTADMAEECGITEDEFIFLSSVVEAESDRSTDGDLSGRILIAEVIINRVNSEAFPDTVSGVLTQRGQFSTVRNGHSITNRSDFSDQAVVDAYREIEDGEAPAVFFFNCIGYNNGTPYGRVGGNYFMLREDLI